MKLLRQYPVTFTVATLVAILFGLLAFGRSAGGFEARVNANTQAIEKHEEQIKKIPVIESVLGDIRDDVGEMRSDIKTLLKK